MPASRVTKSGRRDQRFKSQGPGFRQQVIEQGAAKPVTQGLGEMPLTLWVLVAGVILYLYIRRANLGIDTHPGEGKKVFIGPPQPKVFIGPPIPNGPFMPLQELEQQRARIVQ